MSCKLPVPAKFPSGPRQPCGALGPELRGVPRKGGSGFGVRGTFAPAPFGEEPVLSIVTRLADVTARGVVRRGVLSSQRGSGVSGAGSGLAWGDRWAASAPVRGAYFSWEESPFRRNLRGGDSCQTLWVCSPPPDGPCRPLRPLPFCFSASFSPFSVQFKLPHLQEIFATTCTHAFLPTSHPLGYAAAPPCGVFSPSAFSV